MWPKNMDVSKIWELFPHFLFCLFVDSEPPYPCVLCLDRYWCRNLKISFPLAMDLLLAWIHYAHLRTLTHSQSIQGIIKSPMSLTVAIKNDNDDISHKWASQTTKITQTVHNRIHDSGQDHIPCVQSRRMHYCCVVVYNFLILSSKPKQQDSWLSNLIAVDFNTLLLFFPKIRYFFWTCTRYLGLLQH